VLELRHGTISDRIIDKKPHHYFSQLPLSQVQVPIKPSRYLAAQHIQAIASMKQITSTRAASLAGIIWSLSFMTLGALAAQEVGISLTRGDTGGLTSPFGLDLTTAKDEVVCEVCKDAGRPYCTCTQPQ
jgi:hypothetical protein